METHPTVDPLAGGLVQAAADLEALVGEVAPELAGRAGEVAARVAAGRFHISVLGEFKRGKSTLINALLGGDYVPTGVLPLTAVPIEIAYGPRGAAVEFDDGTCADVELPAFDDYATERGNPRNERGVSRVRLTLPVDLLETGAVLVDTPGLGSLHAHNTDSARRAVGSTDGAVVVLSADAPFSEEERRLLATLGERLARTFVVLNRVDNLDPGGLAEVRAFVTSALREHLGGKPGLYPLSARQALQACRGEAAPEPGFESFAHDFRAFVTGELAEVRDAAARRALAAMADRVDSAVELEAAALALTVEELDERLERFAVEGVRQRRAFDEDRLLLAHAVGGIARDLAATLAAATAEEPPGAAEQLAEAARAAPTGRLEASLDDAVARLVRERFEDVRTALSSTVEEAWQVAAGEFRQRVEQRSEGVRVAAEELFAMPLYALEVPAVDAVTEEFTYQLERLPRTGEDVARALRRLLPGGWVRRRAVLRSRRRLAEQLDKHAGRARHDLARRLQEAHEDFAEQLARHLDDLTRGVVAAGERARARQGAVGTALAAERERVEAVRRRTDAVRRALEPAGAPARGVARTDP